MMIVRTVIIILLLSCTLLHAEIDGILFHQETRTFTLDVREQSLSSVLAEIAGQTGLRIHLSPAADQPISIQLHNTSPEETVKAIVKSFHLNTLYSYEKKDNRTQLKQVTILPQGEKHTTAIMPSNSPADAPRQPDKSSRRLPQRRPTLLWEKLGGDRHPAGGNSNALANHISNIDP